MYLLIYYFQHPFLLHSMQVYTFTCTCTCMYMYVHVYIPVHVHVKFFGCPGLTSLLLLGYIWVAGLSFYLYLIIS